MVRWLAGILVVGMLVAAGLLQKRTPHLPQGVITIKRMACAFDEQLGAPVFKLTAVNTTDQSIDKVAVELLVGQNGNLSTKYVDVDDFGRGDFLQLEEALPATSEPNACSAKFYISEHQLTAVYRP